MDGSDAGGFKGLIGEVDRFDWTGLIGEVDSAAVMCWQFTQLPFRGGLTLQHPLWG